MSELGGIPNRRTMDSTSYSTLENEVAIQNKSSMQHQKIANEVTMSHENSDPILHTSLLALADIPAPPESGTAALYNMDFNELQALITGLYSRREEIRDALKAEEVAIHRDRLTEQKEKREYMQSSASENQNINTDEKPSSVHHPDQSTGDSEVLNREAQLDQFQQAYGKEAGGQMMQFLEMYEQVAQLEPPSAQDTEALLQVLDGLHEKKLC